jgi:hypothetical protein
MAFAPTAFVDTQTWSAGKIIVESVLDAGAEVSLQAFSDALAAVLGGANGIPALYAEEDLLLRGGLDFDFLYSIHNLRSLEVNSVTKVAYLSGYGAAGDGVTSDRAAFIAALTDLQVGGGGILYVEQPEDKYLIDGEIAFTTGTFPAGVPVNITIEGLGTQPELYLETGDADSMFNVNNVPGIRFKNLSFTGDSAQGSGWYIEALGDNGAVVDCTFDGAGTMSAISQFWSGGLARHLEFTNLVFAAFTGSASATFSIADSAYARLRGLTFISSAGTPGTALQLAAPAAGRGNDEILVDGLHVLRNAGAAANSACLQVAANHAERCVITNFTLDTSVGGLPAVEILGSNVTLTQGHINCNSNTSLTDGILLDGADDIIISNVAILGNDGRDGSTTDCEGFGIRIDAAPDGIQILGCRIRGFNASAGRAVGPSGETPVDLHMSGNLITNNANGGTQVDIGGTAYNYGFDANYGSAAGDANYEV